MNVISTSRELIHSFIADRVVKTITNDTLVDMVVGTGAAKITPAQGPNNLQWGAGNNLEFINIFDDEGKINQKLW